MNAANQTGVSVTIHKGSELWDVEGGSRGEQDDQGVQGVSADRSDHSDLTRRFRFVAIAAPGLAVNDQTGKILATGAFDQVRTLYPDSNVVDHGSGVLLPGFIDAHLHFPQLHGMGSYGSHLIEWLENYIFPLEAQFSDQSVALRTGQQLCRELAGNGVSTSVIFSSVHPLATEILFQCLDDAGLRSVVGKTSMDCNAPPEVLLDWRADVEAQEELISRWHGHDGRLHYAVTPRFVLTSSSEQMAALGELHARYPDTYIQTHVSECKEELHSVASAYPDFVDYLSIYERYGLINNRTLLGHGIYLSDSERSRLASCGATVVHCPTSNTFLGSGLLDLKGTSESGVKLALGSDIGAGTSLSPWSTMLDAYKVQALLGQPVDPTALFYLATLAGAEALRLDATTGSLAVGKDADFQVIKPERRAILAERLAFADTPVERLFATIVHGDDRIHEALYVRGRIVGQKQY